MVTWAPKVNQVEKAYYQTNRNSKTVRLTLSRYGKDVCCTPQQPLLCQHQHAKQFQLLRTLRPDQKFKYCLRNISNFACQACLRVWPPRQTLLDKHILLVNFQKHFFACHKQKIFVKHMFVWWPNRQALPLTSKTSNVCQTMLVPLAGALGLLDRTLPGYSYQYMNRNSNTPLIIHYQIHRTNPWGCILSVKGDVLI